MDAVTFRRLFEPFGDLALDSAEANFLRFAITKSLYERTPASAPAHVLDIGAHWLHQSVLYARDGYRVTAADVPDLPGVKGIERLADHFAIRRVSYATLENPVELDAIAESSVDLVLFTEIIEHLAFNPVAMWKMIYRVLKPGGVIVVTTPNYYYLHGRAMQPLRFLTGRGGGIDAVEILRASTYGHHWKEFSLAELFSYFAELSPDFSVRRAERIVDYYPHRRSRVAVAASRAIQRVVPAVRRSLHLEVQLKHKRAGIVPVPGWI